MSKTIEFYFDFGSPTAYLAHTQLPGIAERTGSEVVYEPILLGGVHKASNNTPPALVPAKGRYLLVHDLPRFVERYQVEFKMNPFFPINTLPLMRGCFAAKELGCFDAYVDAMFKAVWTQGVNMGQPEEIGKVVASIGADPQQFVELIGQDSIKNQLKENTEKVVAKGAFGAPTMYVGDQMYFGQDRLDFLEADLQA